jgi:hypothetical protein
MITTSKNDKYVGKIDAMNYEKSLGTQFKQAWTSFTAMWGGDDASERPRPASPAPKASQLKKEKDLVFPIEVFEQLLYAKSKNHGVTIKTMTRVSQDNRDQRAYRKRRDQTQVRQPYLREVSEVQRDTGFERLLFLSD